MLKRIGELLRSLREHAHVLIWVMRVIREYRLYLCAILGLSIVSTLMGIFFSVFVKHLIDGAAYRNIRLRLVQYAVLLTGWTSLGALLGYATSLYYDKIAFSVRRRVFHAVLRADWLQISRVPVGDLNSRISGDAGVIANYACDVFPSLVGACIQLAVVAVIVFFINPWLLTMLLAGGLVSGLLMMLFRLKLKPLHKELRKREVEESSYQTELCTNLLTVKGLCREDVGEERFHQFYESKYAAKRHKNRFFYTSNGILNIFFDMGYLLVFGWAVLNLGRGNITYGMLSMLIALEGYIQGPISNIATSLPDFVYMLVAADRLEEVVRMGANEPESPGEIPAGKAVSLAVRDLSFTYPTHSAPVLHDIRCDIPAGSIAVIIGPSGCGKTTLLHLIMGLLTPAKGSVAFTDEAGHTIPAGRDARLRMGYVPQGNTLFSGTILENICFGLPEDEAAAREALAVADALRFVDELPEGIHTMVGENSRGISVGQAQRVAIARAVYMKPALLILDEATSALDRDTERRILTAIREMPDRPTVLCVTHREGALQIADQVIPIEHGALTRKEYE